MSSDGGRRALPSEHLCGCTISFALDTGQLFNMFSP